MEQRAATPTVAKNQTERQEDERVYQYINARLAIYIAEGEIDFSSFTFLNYRGYSEGGDQRIDSPNDFNEQFYESVLTDAAFDNAVVGYETKRSSYYTGKFYAAMPNNWLTRFHALSVKFEDFIVHNHSLGYLTMSIPRAFDPEEPIEFFLKSITLGLQNGLFNRKTIDELKTNFEKFNVVITSAHLGSDYSTETNEDYGKMDYYSISLGPYELDDIINEKYSFYKKVEDDINKHIENQEDRFVSGDMAKFQLFADLPDNRNKKAAQIIQKQIEKVRIVLLPKVSDTEMDVVEEDVERTRKSRRIGCIPKKKDWLESDLLRDAHLWTPLNTMLNNCFIQCVRQHYTLLEKQHAERTMFLDLCFEEQAEKNHDLSLDDLDDVGYMKNVSKAMKIDFYFYEITPVVYNEPMEEMEKDDKGKKARISSNITMTTHLTSHESESAAHFLIHNGHCHLVTNEKFVLNKVKCSLCCHWINLMTFSRHKEICRFCAQCNRAYTDKKEHVCSGESFYKRRRESTSRSNERRKEQATVKDTNGNDIICKQWIKLDRPKKPKKLTSDKFAWAVDIEAFPDKSRNGAFTPCAIALSRCDSYDTYRVFSGEDCMAQFLQFIMSKEVRGSLYFYNGSRFDSYLLMNAMLKHGYYINPAKIIKNGGAIMTFDAKHDLKVFIHLF